MNLLGKLIVLMFLLFCTLSGQTVFNDDFSGNSYGSNIIPNGDFSIDSNGDGLADNWYKSGSGTVNTYIVNGAQKVEATTTSQTMILYQDNTVEPSSIYMIEYEVVATHPNMRVTVFDLTNSVYIVHYNDAKAKDTSIGKHTIYFATASNTNSVKIYFGHSAYGFNAGEYFTVDNVSVKKLTKWKSNSDDLDPFYYGGAIGLTKTSPDTAFLAPFSVTYPGNYVAFVRAKATSNTTLIFLINNNKSVSGSSIGLKDAFVTFLVPFGYLDTNNDTLMIYANSQSDSVIIDDIKIEKRDVQVKKSSWVKW